MGSPSDPSNFINAVIDERSFDKIAGFIDFAHKADDAQIVAGGSYNKEKGYFVEPTVIVTDNPKFRTMCEEIFGPVITIYNYEDGDYESTLELLDETSDYALTGSIMSKDRYAADLALKKLQNAAGNFYVNDKPTGAVVGQQPFGGARGSGTNDKAGSYLKSRSMGISTYYQRNTSARYRLQISVSGIIEHLYLKKKKGACYCSGPFFFYQL